MAGCENGPPPSTGIWRRRLAERLLRHHGQGAQPPEQVLEERYGFEAREWRLLEEEFLKDQAYEIMAQRRGDEI